MVKNSPATMQEAGLDTRRLVSELNAMVRYALAQKLEVPDEVVAILEKQPRPEEPPEEWSRRPEVSYGKVIRAHLAISKLIAPVTSVSLRATAGKDPASASPTTVPLILWMIVAALLSAVGYVVFLVWPPNRTVGDQFLYFFAAAGGASFYALMEARSYVKSRTFDPSYQTEYLVRFALGVLGGVLLANAVIQFNAIQSVPFDFPPALIALLGGFAADAVDRILKRLVETLEALINGLGTEALERQKAALEIAAEARVTELRMKAAWDLLDLETKLGGGLSSEEVRQHMRELADTFVKQSKKP